jgi:hypothetical protein
MAMATPARMFDTSRRVSANDPAMPVATATTRSSTRGAVRPRICGLASSGIACDVSAPTTKPMAMLTAMPPTSRAAAARRCFDEPMTVASATP